MSRPDLESSICFPVFGVGKKNTNRKEAQVFRIKFAATVCNNALPKPAYNQISRLDFESPGPLFPASDSFPLLQRYSSISLKRNAHPPRITTGSWA